MHWRLGLVVALAVLAGCSALGTTGDTPTVTPAPIPEQTETTPENPLPPGVTGSDITDLDELTAAHARTSRNRSYTWQDRYVVVMEDNRSLNVTRIVRVENETTYTYWTNRREAPRDSPFDFLGSYTEYNSREGRYTRFDDRGRLRYERALQRPASARIVPQTATAVREYLWVENATVAVILVDGQRYYEIEGEDYVPPSRWGVENYTVSAVVSPEGFVRSIDASYDRTRGGEQERIRYSFQYTKVGNTTVEEPDWVRQQWNQSTETARP